MTFAIVAVRRNPQGNYSLIQVQKPERQALQKLGISDKEWKREAIDRLRQSDPLVREVKM